MSLMTFLDARCESESMSFEFLNDPSTYNKISARLCDFLLRIEGYCGGALVVGRRDRMRSALKLTQLYKYYYA